MASSIILLVFLLFTDPRDLSAWLLAVPFLLLFIALLLTSLMILSRYKQGKAKKLRLGVSLSLIPVMLLALQSLGQLTVRDAVVLSIFFGISYLYVARLGVRQAG